MSDKEMVEFLGGVVGAVEATSFERLCLWQERDKTKPWVQGLSGFLERVGEINDLPVCISLQVDEVDGHRLLFYNATSRAVDHDQIKTWLHANLPDTAKRDGRVNRVDAMNFHNVFRRF